MTDLPRSRDGQDVAIAYESFRRAILNGELRPGEIMTQQQVADRLGISRTPLREAIRILQHEGLLNTEPHRRLQVAEFSIEDVETVYVMRVLLEGAAARITVPGLQPRDIAEMKGFMAQMEHYQQQPDELDAWEIPHRAFHAVLVSAAGGRMATTIRQLSDHAERYRRAYLISAPSSYEISAAEHGKVLEAAGAHDTDSTAALLAAHYLRTANSVIREIDPSHEPTKLHLAVGLVGGRILA
jgi:DNA-binding GntR family transcriptional regulator